MLDRCDFSTAPRRAAPLPRRVPRRTAPYRTVTLIAMGPRRCGLAVLVERDGTGWTVSEM
jgi:hypothetical protein